MNTNYKKGIHVQFFLLHEQKKWVISNFTQSGLKKKKERKKEPRLSRCPESFTFGFFCSLVPWEATSGRSRPLEVSAASLHPPRQKLRSGAPSFLCSDPGRRRWAQQDGEEGRETWRIRFPPPPQSGSRCTRVSDLQRGETGGHRSEEQQPRSDEQLAGRRGLNAPPHPPNPPPSRSYQWNSRCWPNSRTEESRKMRRRRRR